MPRGGGGGGGGSKRGSQQQGWGNQPPRKVISIGLQKNVKLHSSENAWVPAQKKKMDVTDGTDGTDEEQTQVCGTG